MIEQTMPSDWERLQQAVDQREAKDVIKIADRLLNAESTYGPLRSRILLQRGWALGTIGKVGPAIEDLRQVLESSEGLSESEVYEAWIELGTVYRYGAMWEESKKAFTAALDLAIAGGDSGQEIQAQVRLASVANLNAEYWEAAELLLSLLPRLHDVSPTSLRDKLTGDCYRELTTYAYSTGQYSRAVDYARQAESAYTQAHARVGRANAIKDRGIALALMLDFSSAKQELSRAAEAFLEVGRPLGVAHSLRRLAEVCMAQNEFHQAHPLLVAAVALYEAQEPPDADGLSSALLLLADALKAANETEKAKSVLSDAAAIAENVSDDLVALTKLRLLLLQTTGQNAQSMIDELEALAVEIETTTDPRIAFEYHSNLGIALMDVGRDEEALGHLLSAVTIQRMIEENLFDAGSRIRNMSQSRELYSRALLAAASTQHVTDAVFIMEVGRAETISRLLESVNTEEDLHVRHLLSNIAHATWSQSDREGEVSLCTRSLHRVQEELEAIDDEYSVLVCALSGIPPDVPRVLEGLSKLLPPGSAWLSVDLDTFGKAIYLAWGTPGNGPSLRRYVIDDSTPAFNNADSSNDDQWRVITPKTWIRMSRILVPPELSILIKNGVVSRLYISVQGRLASLPWPAVRIGRRLLAQMCTLSLVPSLALLHSLLSHQGGAPNEEVWISYCIDEQLPGSEIELRVLGELPRTHRLTGPDVVSILENGDLTGVLAISSHGSQDPGPRQALTLPGGVVLTATDLVAGRLPSTVALGACWSGVIDSFAGRDSFGLAVAALGGGARTVIGGRRAIDSREAGRVLGRWYKAMSEGHTPAESLRLAQTTGWFWRFRTLTRIMERMELTAIGL